MNEIKKTPALWRTEALFKKATAEELEKLKVFHVELLNTNRRMNLISVTTEQNADVIHFYDSYVACRYILQEHPNLEQIYDFGSGNGFPGAIMAILSPKTEVNLVESDSRKAEFLKYLAGRMSIRNMRVHNKRLEDMDFTGSEVCMCRGFAELGKTLMFGRKLSAGALVYSMKGPGWNREVASLPHQICSTWNTDILKEYQLPEVHGERVILCSKKIK